MASLKDFPKALYKGNSVNVNFKVDKNGESYIFQVGDIVRVGIKETLDDDEYQLYKEFNITEQGDTLQIYFAPEETDKITTTETKGILEVELVYNEGKSVKTVYQQSVNLEGVVINE